VDLTAHRQLVLKLTTGRATAPLAVCLIRGNGKRHLLSLPAYSPMNLHTNNNTTQHSSKEQNDKHLSIHNTSINHMCTAAATTTTTTTTTTNTTTTTTFQ